MKKLFAIILSVISVAYAAISLNSCSSSVDKESVQLLSAPSSLNLSRADSSQISEVGLSCGCNFDPLITTGYGGDTSVIHFLIKDALASVTTHSIYAAISPSELKSSGADSAWIALFYMEQDGSDALLYDTIHAYANY